MIELGPDIATVEGRIGAATLELLHRAGSLPRGLHEAKAHRATHAHVRLESSEGLHLAVSQLFHTWFGSETLFLAGKTGVEELL